MIPRYSRPDMVAIWSPETKFRIWFEIEAYACDALADLGVIPKSAAETIWEKGGKAEFDVARIDGGDRRTAIRTALAAAEPGEWVAILGKGHEQGQEIAGVITPFDDVTVAAEAWQEIIHG